MSYAPEHFTIWAEIPVTDMERGMAFYRAVTDADLKLDTSGPNPIAVFKPKDPDSGVGGHLYPGTPALAGTGPTIHLSAPGKLEDTIARVETAGGTVQSGPIALPAGRFFYALDPDGNSVGFFEEKR